MAKRRKTATRSAAKKSAKKSTNGRAKRAVAGQKRKTSRRKSRGTMSFFDHFLKLFADSGTRKT
jgi:hypothetical protein